MASKWRKAKLALGLNLCYYVPRSSTVEDDDDSQPAALLSHTAATTTTTTGDDNQLISTTEQQSTCPPLSVPAPQPAVQSTSKVKLSRSSSRSSSSKKMICTICLDTMKFGRQGQAIFTAECTHSFHFHCITDSVKHGNKICPVCRAVWKEIPLQSPSAAANQIMPQDQHDPATVMTLIRRLPPPNPSRPRTTTTTVLPPPPLLLPREPALFNDDEQLTSSVSDQRASTDDPATSSTTSNNNNNTTTIDIKTYPEYPSLHRTKPYQDFTVLIHLKALPSPIPTTTTNTPQRTPVDLVTVIDTSGSMCGTKLTLLKNSIKFVIQNLTSHDRLSIITFSSTARRLFPLRKMTSAGRQQALNSLTTLTANGGTNIAEGLRKAVKVMEQRRERNLVGSIVLLSDGQDTYTINRAVVDRRGRRNDVPKKNYQLLLPVSDGVRVPIHTFGFGVDHDATAMHEISECSGGMFSFIESECAIQDAFAQCIGGILSVVVQNLEVGIECTDQDHSSRLVSIKSGSYESSVSSDGRLGRIKVGDLYADEERDFLVSISVPAESNSDSNTSSLLRVKCEFTDPSTNKTATQYGDELRIERTDAVINNDEEALSIEVDRERNRVRAAEAMTAARTAAERGDLGTAIAILEECRAMLGTTKSGKCMDKLCVGLDAEMKEMQQRMGSRQVYEKSGRAYVLSGLSSHSWQRATARGDSVCGGGGETYQTPSMVEMVSRSRTESLVVVMGGGTSSSPTTPPNVEKERWWSFGSPKPR